MKINRQILILIVLLVLMAVIFLVSFHFPYVQAKLAPMTISGLLILLTGGQLLREVGWSRKPPQTGRSPENPAGLGRGGLRPYVLQGGWMVGFLIAIACLGFLVAIPLFCIAYMRAHGTGWWKSIIISALLVIVIYALFDRILDVELYAGWIPGLLLG